MDEQTVTIEAPAFPPPAPPPPRPSRRWYQLPVSRDPSDHKVGGVIGGLSRTYGFDVRTTRIAVLIATIVLPVIIAVYGAAWLLLPARPEEAVSLEHIVRDRRRVPLYIAVGLVLVAGGAGSFGSWFFLGGLPWGLGLIAVGVLLWVAPGLTRSSGDHAAAPAPQQPVAPRTTTTVPTVQSDATVLTDAMAPPPPPTDPFATTTTTLPTGATRPLHIDDIRPRRKRRPVGSLVTLAVLTFVGVAAAGDALDWWNIPVLTTLVISLVSTAVGMVVSSIVNRSWMGLTIVPILAVVTTGLLITHPNLDGGIGERTLELRTVEQAQRSQHLGVGELTIDLADVPLTAQPIEVHAEVGIGHLQIVVPQDATLVIDAEIGAGDATIDGDTFVDGFRAEEQLTVQPAGVSSGTIELDVQMGTGRIDIVRAPV